MLAWQGRGQPEALEELGNVVKAWGDSCSDLSGGGHSQSLASVQSQLSISSLPLQIPGFFFFFTLGWRLEIGH